MSSVHPDEDAADAVLTSPETQAIEVGLADAEKAIKRSHVLGFLHLFTRPGGRPLAHQGLEAIRAYAEMRRALYPGGAAISTASLAACGYSARQQSAILSAVNARLDLTDADTG